MKLQSVQILLHIDNFFFLMLLIILMFSEDIVDIIITFCWFGDSLVFMLMVMATCPHWTLYGHKHKHNHKKNATFWYSYTCDYVYFVAVLISPHASFILMLMVMLMVALLVRIQTSVYSDSVWQYQRSCTCEKKVFVLHSCTW